MLRFIELVGREIVVLSDEVKTEVNEGSWAALTSSGSHSVETTATDLGPELEFEAKVSTTTAAMTGSIPFSSEFVCCRV